MKNLFKFMMAVAVLFTASCAKEDISSSIVANGETVEVTFSANLADLGTRANEYGSGAHANTLQFFVYQYDGESSVGDYLPDVKVYTGDQGSNVITKNGGNKFNFSLTLVKGMKYNILFWADKGNNNTPDDTTDDSIYSVDSATGVVTADYDGVLANNETLDAFFGVLDCFDPADDNAASRANAIELKRPFAQLNAFTNDLAIVEQSGATLTKSSLAVNTYTTLNLFNGDVDGAQDVTFQLANIPTDGAGHISMNYLLAPATKCTADVTFDYTFDGKNVAFPEATYTFVPLKANYKTNIIGNLLTGSTNFNVTINPIFEGTIENKVVEVKTAAELNTALSNPEVGTVVMQDNIETEGFVFGAPASRAAVTYNGRDIVIDGNGKTLTYKGAAGGRIIDFKSETNGANLTIKNLTIINNVSYIERAVNYNTNGTLTLEDVTIKSAEGCSLNYAINLPGFSDNAKVEIKNCKIWAGAQALNLWGEKTVVNVTNSELYVVDDSAAEGRSVVAINNDGETIADYSVLNFIGGSIKVVYVGEGETMPSYAIRNNTAHSTINVSDNTEVVGAISNPVAIIYWEGFNQYYSSADLNAALDAAVPKYNATGVRMIKDLTLPLAKKAIYGTPVAVQMKNGGVFDGCNNTLSVENPEYNAYVVETYGGTIKNLNITTPAGRGIMISSPKEDIYLDNVLVNGPGYALNTTEHKGKKLVVTNSTFKGWTSLAGLESVSFTSCTFGENTYAYWQKFGYDKDYDRLLRPYVSTLFDSCKFENDYVVLLDNLAASATVTLKNCVCGEVEITAENYSQFITIELPEGRTLTDCVVFE